MAAPVRGFTMWAPKSCFLKDPVFLVDAGDAPGKFSCSCTLARSAVKGPGCPEPQRHDYSVAEWSESGVSCRECPTETKETFENVRDKGTSRKNPKVKELDYKLKNGSAPA